MKQRTMALLLTAALGIFLLGITALAVEGGDMPAPDTSASQPETIQTPDEMTVSPEEPPLQSEEQSGTEEEEGSFDTSFEEYIPDPVGSISFSNVERRMREGNLQIKALQESIEIIDEIDYDKLKDQLRYQLNELAKNQWNLVTSSKQLIQAGIMSDYEYHSAYDQLDRAYDAVRKQFDDITEGDMQENNADTKRQLQSLQNQIIMAGEATYIALAAMELQEDGLERQLAALDRQLTELDLRYQLGHISSMTLKQARSGRAALDSGLSTLRMNLDTYKGQFELLIGADITGRISLNTLPKVTNKDLDRMDLEKDLEKAKANSWDIYQATETMKEELKTYNGHGGEFGYTYKKDDSDYMRIRHNWYTAKYTYDNTIQNFELGLRNLYLKVQDYRQILDAAKTALAVEQDNYAVAQLKQSQGTLSQNGLLEAEDKLKQAGEKVAAGENDLFSAYNTYRWAVDYGIMN